VIVLFIGDSTILVIIEYSISNFSLHNYVLIEELDLILKIPLNYFLEHPNVSQITSLVEDYFEFFSL